MKSKRLYGWMLATALIMAPHVSEAQVTWHANVGAETKDQGVQADAFLSNELWILEGDSIRWTFVPKNEIHTVTFLKPSQVRPPFPVGCPGAQASGASYSGGGVREQWSHGERGHLHGEIPHEGKLQARMSGSRRHERNHSCAPNRLAAPSRSILLRRCGA